VVRNAVRDLHGERHHRRIPRIGTTPSEAEKHPQHRHAMAKQAEEVGLDVFALGEHHNPPFWSSSSPTTTLAYIAAQTERTRQLSTATTLITTNDPVKIAEDYAMLQHVSADGRVRPDAGRGNTGPVYPWFGKDIRQGLRARDRELQRCSHRLWREDVVDWQGQFRTPLQGFTSTPRPLDGVAPVRVARVDPYARDRRAGGVLRRRVLREQHLLAEGALPCALITLLPPALRALRARHCRRRRSSGLGRPGRSWRPKSQDAVNEFRPYFDNAPVYGHGPSLEDFSEHDPADGRLARSR
jgi:hypothetical protein